MRTWLIILGWIAGCASGPAPDISLRKGEVDQKREEAAKLWREQRNLEWHAWTRGTTLDLAETFRGHEALYSRQTAEQLLAAMNATPDRGRQRALRYLRRMILWELTGFETAGARDGLETIKQTALLSVDGRQVALQQLQVLQAKEPDGGKRRALQEAAAPLFDRLTEAHLALDRAIGGASRTLGFKSYLELSNELRLCDLSELGRAAEAFLADTDALYLPAAKRVVKQELDTDFELVRLSDMPRLLRSPRYDAWFPEETVLSLQAATLAPLGMSLHDQLGATLDTEKRAATRRRPRTFPLVVPSDVRTSIVPEAGVLGHEAAMHEAGHVLTYTRTTTPVFEFQVLGDETVVYAYAFVLQNLVGHPEWLRTHATRMPEAEQTALARYVAWRRLALARRYAAKVAFEVAWHDGQKPDLAQLYQNLMSKAHGFRLDEVDAKRWLVDHEPFFLSAQFLRAWFLAAQIEQKLVAAFGARWFERREAGDWLTGYMRRGLEPTADELARELGRDHLDGAALIDVLKAQL